jgi:hypothetical protein
MASSSRKRQTIAKRNRERAVKEKRALKQEKKEARKQAAAEARGGTTADVSEAAVPADPITPAQAVELLHDGTGAPASQHERDVEHQPGSPEPGQVDDDQRHVADDDPVRQPDRVAG